MFEYTRFSKSIYAHVYTSCDKTISIKNMIFLSHMPDYFPACSVTPYKI